ncbi:MAG TPA: Do family serine endopeptidase [Segetibacter sp.]|jgi:Do/DeqQ family serine protease
MKLKNILLVVLISSTSALLSVWGYNKWEAQQFAGQQEQGKLPVNYAGFFDKDIPAGAVDFTAASTSATPAVVHIKTKTKARQASNNLPRGRNPFADLFGDDMDDFFNAPQSRTIPEQRASGSGVIISNDGYIVTNNHVIEGADELNVTLNNKRTYKATLVGADPSTDIAVLKIEGKNLPYLVYGNSDEVRLGQWVLAVGYPLTLDVTVTAGIISAKARSIGINSRQSENPIESFLQTDAAVNQGNSGGALINTEGQLIGINSAIASPTGSYAGYSYAVPVNIVKKAVNDLIKFGTVQRAYLGINYAPESLTDEQKKEIGWKESDGVFITGVPAGGAAAAAGLKVGDVVLKVNGVTVTSGPEMQEQVTRYKPGDKVTLTYLRDGKENIANLTLKNKVGNTDVVKRETVLDKIGGVLTTLDKKTATSLEIPGGVVVKKVDISGPLKNSRIQEGFVITTINGQAIKSLEELSAALEANKGRTVKVEGVYPGFSDTYGYPLRIQ